MTKPPAERPAASAEKLNRRQNVLNERTSYSIHARKYKAQLDGLYRVVYSPWTRQQRYRNELRKCLKKVCL